MTKDFSKYYLGHNFYPKDIGFFLSDFQCVKCKVRICFNAVGKYITCNHRVIGDELKFSCDEMIIKNIIE